MKTKNQISHKLEMQYFQETFRKIDLLIIIFMICWERNSYSSLSQHDVTVLDFNCY